MTETRVACGACGEPLDERPNVPVDERQGCPRCGSTSRRFGIHLESTVELKSQLGLKARSPGEKKPFLEQKTGDDFFRKAGRWMALNRIIDRRRNRYFERVEDPETGVVLRRLDALREQDAELAQQLATEATSAPDTADLEAVAKQLEHTIAEADPKQAKALLRLLIKDLHVNGKSEILPTYRIVTPEVCALPSSVGGTGLEPVTPSLSSWCSPN
jgi:hypothetical protein